jgi:hypothetical protein
MNLLAKKDFQAFLLFLLCIFLYAIHADYGHRVNDFSYINNVEIDSSNVGTALERNSINGAEVDKLENTNKWLMRFRLYSIDADEMNTIMALARIKPKELKFDPHHYSYGGGYLYPLGMWFFILEKIGVIQTGSLDWMINNPEEMDNIYHAGRVFTLAAFFISVLFLYYSLKIIRDQKFALIASLIYLSTPSIFMFSMVMKPHVYALLWANMSIFILTRSYLSKRFTFKNVIFLGFTLGIMVGSVITYAFFAIIAWLTLFTFANKGKLKYSNLVILPIVSIIIYLLVNPYIVLNYEAFLLETTAQKSWFFFGSNLQYVWLLLTNSLIPGFGIGIVILLLYIISFAIINPPVFGVRLITLSIVFVLLFISFISASVSDWHINSRYIFYLVPIILYLSALYKKINIKILYAILFFTFLQMFPLFLAHHDEDSFTYSTRLQAAEWINENVLNDEAVCTKGRSIVPYDSPPFNFIRVIVDYENCDYFISIDRQPDKVIDNINEKPLIRFEPRFNIKSFPLVYSHINPQISIYKK